MNDLDGRICEQGVGCPGNMQVMGDVALGFLQGHPRKMEPQVQPLHNRLMDLRAENPPKFWLPQENQAHRRKGVHLEVGQKAYLFQHLPFEQVPFIDDEHRCLAMVLIEIQDNPVKLALGIPSVKPGDVAKLVQDFVVEVMSAAYFFPLYWML